MIILIISIIATLGWIFDMDHNYQKTGKIKSNLLFPLILAISLYENHLILCIIVIIIAIAISSFFSWIEKE